MTEIYDPAGDRVHTADYKRYTPDILAKFSAFDDAVFAKEGRALPLHIRELMAVAVATTTQCVYCIDFHTRAALAAGASETELAEALWVSTALRAGGGYTHGRLAFKLSGPHEH